MHSVIPAVVRTGRRNLKAVFRTKTQMVAEGDALPGRTDQTMPVPDAHFVNGHPLKGPWPEGYQTAVFGLGCFWGAERVFWQTPGRVDDRGRLRRRLHPEPHLRGGLLGAHRSRRGRARRLRPGRRDATTSSSPRSGRATTRRQGMRQGNDVGTQYRSAIYLTDESQRAAAEASRERFAAALRGSGYGDVTTEIAPLGEFWYAEPYHQQYLAKNPGGYCGLGGTGVSCPVGVAGTS